MNEHTRGPWTITDATGPDADPSDSHDFPLEVMSAWEGHVSLLVAAVQDEADARLIAAAPDLLEALLEMQYARTDKALAMADAALAKVAGVPPSTRNQR